GSEPSALKSWLCVIMKEDVGRLAYALYANSNADQPLGSVFTTSAFNATGTPQLGLSTWTHLAMTWDGSNVRLYLDGALIASHAAAGSLVTGTGALRIGGNSVRQQFFSSAIHRVCAYNRALSAAAIDADMNAPVDP